MTNRELLTPKGRSVLNRVMRAGSAGIAVGLRSDTYAVCYELANAATFDGPYSARRIPLVRFSFHPKSGYKRVHYIVGSLTDLYKAELEGEVYGG